MCCEICGFRMQLPEIIRENAPGYSEAEVYALHCRVITTLDALHDKGFRVEPKVDSQEFSTEHGLVHSNYVAIIGTKGDDAIVTQFMLSAHNGIQILATQGVDGMDCFHDKRIPFDKPRQELLADWQEETGHLFSFYFYTDDEIDAKWEIKASKLYQNLLDKIGSAPHEMADLRASTFRSILGTKGGSNGK
jgi:hypothetical protein